MAVAVFNELGARLERACKEEEFSLKVKKLGWRDPAVGWRFQYWDSAVKHLVEDKSKKPLTDHSSAEARPASVDTGPGSSLRMQAEDGGNSNVPHGPVHSNTPKLRGMAFSASSARQLGGIASRKESFKPSPGIAKIKEMIRLR